LRGKDQKSAERARSLRRSLTPAEFALWTRLRGRQLGGFKFVRQEPIDIENLDGVLQTLLPELEQQPLTPARSPQARRGRYLA
jgi:very-short-patch-repair endonuclease